MPPTEDVHRPDLAHWILYAFGAGVPERNRTWVLHDVTAPTWVLRHLLRSVVQIVPFAVVLYLVLPFPVMVIAPAILMGAVIGMLYSAAFVEAAVEHRAIKAGYPEGYATAVRHERHRRAREDRRGRS